MKLFYFPGACSLAVDVILEEIGKPFERVKVDLAKGEQFKGEFTSVNPKAKVPALLRDDGSLLTELPAISWWLAKTHPELGLIPDGAEAEARLLEVLDYMVATVHMRGFSRIFGPARFTPTKADEPAIVQTGRDVAADGLKALSHTLGAKPYLLGDYSIADAMLFCLEFWSLGRAQVKLPENLAAHFERMKARPAVARALAGEGLA
ncbi:glutathione S-transferase family protein [Acidocella sp.]|uniref:glutathione S-transferase family protein n=1 Tax=Acidocella sp. TaxID=50710 RepID=UPI00262202C0|nr:glutathione S-transferase [Acidocella sp.]